MEDILLLKVMLFKERLHAAIKKKSPDFKSLKLRKNKDPEGYICELFKDEEIGNDLKLSILIQQFNNSTK